MFEPIQVNEWVTVRLDDGGKYGMAIQEGRVKNDGTFQVAFCGREFGKMGEKVTKTVPVSIKIGQKEKAIEVLEALLFQLRDDAAPF